MIEEDYQERMALDMSHKVAGMGMEGDRQFSASAPDVYPRACISCGKRTMVPYCSQGRKDVVVHQKTEDDPDPIIDNLRSEGMQPPAWNQEMLRIALLSARRAPVRAILQV